jgi:hypothetical protein
VEILDFFELQEETPQELLVLQTSLRLVIKTIIITVLRHKNADLGYSGAAIYLHVVIDRQRIQRFYVGQTLNLADRLQKCHMDFRHRRINPSLHYYAMDHSCEDYYVTLAYIPDQEGCEQLGVHSPQRFFYNILEMWCSLMLRTLSEKYLDEFLPPDIKQRDKESEYLNTQLPLNVRLPLAQDTRPDWAEPREVLLNSRDHLCRKYYLETLKRCYPNDRTALKYKRLIEERYEKLDTPPTPGRTPPSKGNQTHRRPGLGDVNRTYPITPPPTIPRAETDSAAHSVGPNTGVDPLQIRYGARSANETKRKRKSFEETPSKPPRGEDAKRTRFPDVHSKRAIGDGGIQRTTVRKLDFTQDVGGWSLDDVKFSWSSQGEGGTDTEER